MQYVTGNEYLYQLTSSRSYILRVELEDYQGNTTYAEYNTFYIGNETSGYKLTVDGYNGTAGGSFTWCLNVPWSI